MRSEDDRGESDVEEQGTEVKEVEVEVSGVEVELILVVVEGTAGEETEGGSIKGVVVGG